MNLLAELERIGVDWIFGMEFLVAGLFGQEGLWDGWKEDFLETRGEWGLYRGCSAQ